MDLIVKHYFFCKKHHENTEFGAKIKFTIFINFQINIDL